MNTIGTIALLLGMITLLTSFANVVPVAAGNKKAPRYHQETFQLGGLLLAVGVILLITPLLAV